MNIINANKSEQILEVNIFKNEIWEKCDFLNKKQVLINLIHYKQPIEGVQKQLICKISLLYNRFSTSYANIFEKYLWKEFTFAKHEDTGTLSNKVDSSYMYYSRLGHKSAVGFLHKIPTFVTNWLFVTSFRL